MPGRHSLRQPLIRGTDDSDAKKSQSSTNFNMMNGGNRCQEGTVFDELIYQKWKNHMPGRHSIRRNLIR